MQIILRPMHICRSYGPEKLIYVTLKCDLDLQPIYKNVSNGTSPPQGQQLCQIILKSMHKCRSYGLDKSGPAHTCTHIHLSKLVTAMSRFTARWLEKKRNNIHVYILEHNPKFGPSSFLLNVFSALEGTFYLA